MSTKIVHSKEDNVTNPVAGINTVSKDGNILKPSFDSPLERYFIPVLCFIILAGLVMIRNIKLFASTHIFADSMILLTLIIIIASGCAKIKDEGSKLSNQPLINYTGCAKALGMSFFSFEGFGVLLPVQDIVANQKSYKNIVLVVLMTVFVITTSFGQFCTMAWGSDISTPLITDRLD